METLGLILLIELVIRESSFFVANQAVKNKEITSVEEVKRKYRGKTILICVILFFLAGTFMNQSMGAIDAKTGKWVAGDIVSLIFYSGMGLDEVMVRAIRIVGFMICFSGIVFLIGYYDFLKSIVKYDINKESNTKKAIRSLIFSFVKPIIIVIIIFLAIKNW